MLRHVVVLLAVASVSLAALSRSQAEAKPEQYKDCDGCYVKDIAVFIPTGQVYPVPNKCEGYRCLGTQVVIESCGTAAAVPPCEVVNDPLLDYPQCCPTIVCPPKDQ